MSNKIEILAYHDGELDDEFLTDIEQLFAKFKFRTSTHCTFANTVIVASPVENVSAEVVGATPAGPADEPSFAPEITLDPAGPTEFVTTLGSVGVPENNDIPTEASGSPVPDTDEMAAQINVKSTDAEIVTKTGKCFILNLTRDNSVNYTVDTSAINSKLIVPHSSINGDTVTFMFGKSFYYLPRYEGRAGTSENSPNLQANNIVRFIIELDGSSDSFPCILEVTAVEGTSEASIVFGADMADYLQSISS